MAPALVVYPLDPTGISQDNLIVGEEHDIGTRKVRYVAPNLGAYYASKMTVVDTATGLPLRADQGYVTERLEMPTVKFRQDVCLIFAITDPTVSKNITLTYQAVGGIYAKSGDAVVQQLYALPDVDRPTNWPALMRKKNEWSSDDLLYDIPGQEGFETTAMALMRIDAMITNGDELGHDLLRKYVSNEVDRLGSATNLTMQNLMSGHTAKPDPHSQYILLTDLGASIAGVRTPKIVAPIDGALSVTYDSVTFSGDQYRALYEIPQAAFQFQLSVENTFTGQLAVDRTLSQSTNSTVVNTGLLPGQRYYWRIRYQNAEGIWSKWSNVASFTTKNQYVVKPAVTLPSQGSTSAIDTPTITASAFAAFGTTDTHASSDWEVWSGAGGTGTKVFSSINDAVNKTSIKITTGLLAVNSTYYVRMRQTGANLGLSVWSDDVAFVTPASFVPSIPGTAFQGGYYGGQISYGGKTYVIVVAPKASGELTTNLVPIITQQSAYSADDSVANTAILKTAGGGAAAVRALSIGGYTDWQVPAKNVLAQMATNLNPALAAIATAFKTGGAEAFSSTPYWSSTCYDWVRDDSYYQDGAPIYGPVAAQDVYAYTAYQGVANQEEALGIIRAGGVDWGSVPDYACPSGQTISNKGQGAGFGTDPSGPSAAIVINRSWRCNYTTQGVIGYEQGSQVVVMTQLYQAYRQNLVSAAVDYTAKTTSSKIRAVRLVDTATLTPPPALPSVFGEPYQGGYYGGQVVIGSDIYALIVSPKALGQANLAFKNSSDSNGSWSTLDGKTYSDVYGANPAVYPACGFAKGLNIGGYTDWYIPARDELEVLYRNLKPTADGSSAQIRDNTYDKVPSGTNNESLPVGLPYTPASPAQTTSALFKLGGSEAFDPYNYWTITQSLASNGTAMCIQAFANGIQATLPKQSTYYSFARAIRRVKIGTLPTTAGLTIGAAFQGGNYVGKFSSGGKTWALVVAPKATGEKAAAWKTTSDPEPDGLYGSFSDGWANTVQQAAGGLHPAASWARGLAIGGYTDWYIPARDELEMLYRTFKPSATASYTVVDRVVANDSNGSTSTTAHGLNDNSIPVGLAYTPTNPAQTGVAAYQTGGAEAFIVGSGNYGSSTMSSTLLAATNRQCWIQAFSNGYQQSQASVASTYYYRAIRRVLVSS